MENEYKCYMKEKIGKVESKLDEILDALKGNELGNPGILPRLYACEKKVSALENFKLKITAKAALIITVISSVLSYLVTIVINYFTSK